MTEKNDNGNGPDSEPDVTSRIRDFSQALELQNDTVKAIEELLKEHSIDNVFLSLSHNRENQSFDILLEISYDQSKTELLLDSAPKTLIQMRKEISDEKLRRENEGESEALGDA